MKLAYFDCFSGISGDMTLGALVDAGCAVEHLRSELRGLQVPGWELTAEKVWKNGMAATYVKVVTEDQSKHRSLERDFGDFGEVATGAGSARAGWGYFSEVGGSGGAGARRAAGKDSFS